MKIAERLKDEKAKVRSNAIDLFCVIVSKDQSCCNNIEEIVGVDMAYRIQEKLQYGILPKLNYEGIVEYSSKMNDRFASSYYGNEALYN